MDITYTTLSKSEAVALEQLVDRYTLAAVVSALVEIADAKAQHVEEAWQDRALAREWARHANCLTTAARKLTS